MSSLSSGGLKQLKSSKYLYHSY